MRANKYRAKRKYNGEWVKGYYVKTQHCSPAQDNELCTRHWIIDEHGIKHEVIAETVGQYIGINDIYRNEIYEGDILKILRSDDSYFGIGVVKFADAQFYVELKSKANADFFALKMLYVMYEVIGNIHDNNEGERDERN